MKNMSTDVIVNKSISCLIDRCPNLTGNLLDLGSGTGATIQLAKDNFDVSTYAVDYTDTLMGLPNQKVDVVDLNHCKLPYEDNFFDAVIFTEVIEHLENHRGILKEINRVIRSGGVLVMSTPNILNLKSRVRFLTYGFYNLFGPLHVNESKLHSTGGHINPISYFYLVHSLLDAGFSQIELTIDKMQKTSLIWLIFLYPVIKLTSVFATKKEKRKFKTIDKHNEQYVDKMNSIECLTGRTIIVSVTK
jgi:ubiquinone/menaquinone biosynthesis C-methylase UbiE